MAMDEDYEKEIRMNRALNKPGLSVVGGSSSQMYLSALSPRSQSPRSRQVMYGWRRRGRESLVIPSVPKWFPCSLKEISYSNLNFF